MALIVASAVAVDPWGWAPYGPLRWTVISTGTLVVAAIALRLRAIEVHKPSALGWLAFLFWAGLASVVALDPLYTWIGTPDRHLGFVTVALFALMFLAGQQLSPPAAVTGLLRAAAVALGAIGLYTLLELFDLAPVDLATASGRPGGPYGSAAYLGAACALLIPITLGAGVAERDSARWRYFAYGAAGLGVVAALASQTRAGWVGLTVAAVATLAVQGRWLQRNWPALATALALLVIVAVISPVGSRVVSAFDFGEGTARGRLDEWQVGAAVAVKHPITGVGLEGYRVAFAEGVDAEYERRYTRQTMPDRAHNGPLDVAVTTGLPGMALYLTAAGFLLLRAARALLSGKPALIGLGAGVIAYLAQQWFLFPIAEVDPLFWLFAGVLVAATSIGRPTRLAAPRWVWAAVLTLASAVLLAGSLDVVADHHVSEAVELLTAGETADALRSADLAAAIRPDSIRYHVIAASVAAGPRSFDGYTWAVERLDAALDLSPGDPILRAERATFSLRLAQAARDVTALEASIAEWEALVADDPVHARYRLELGNGYAIAGNDAAAEEQWVRAADLAPNSTTPLTNLATLYINNGRHEAAADMLSRARVIDPTSPVIEQLSEQIAP
jgi:O-antigen ligase